MHTLSMIYSRNTHWGIEVKLIQHHGLTIYMFPSRSPEQDLAPFPGLSRLGCQRVAEPVLSPLLYKSKPFKGR